MEFHKVACFGTGLVGGSWATLFALKGIEVILYDLNEDAVNEAVKRVESNLDALIREGVIEKYRKKKAIEDIRTAPSLKEAAKGVEYIQESVFEDYSIKKEVYSKLDRLTSSNVILASSSSGLLMSKIQKGATRPERCVIAHPWNPPHLIPLVEIVPGEKTSRDTVEKTRRFMSDIGKIPVVLNKEVPGFIGNRLSAALWREAINLLNDGVASAEDIDKALYAGPGFRWAIMGPFMTYHLGGGEGGIRKFIDGIGRTFSNYWKTMNTWTSIPEEAIDNMIEEMNRVAGERQLNEITNWRDKRILELLRVLHPSTFE